MDLQNTPGSRTPSDDEVIVSSEPDSSCSDIAESMVDELMSEWAESHKEMTVAVVDPFTSGATLAERVSYNGYTVANVISDPSSNRARSAKNVDWKSPMTILHSGDSSGRDPEGLRQTADRLRSIGNVKAVLAGAEEGVELADRLAHALGLPGNGLAKSQARRNKFAMNEAVRAAGHRAAKQRHVHRLEQALEFFEKEVGRQPVVIKPLASMKSEDVFCCKTTEEVTKAFETIAGKRNFLNLENDGALIQEYLDGEEYVVDATSLRGKHKVNCCWFIDRASHKGQFNVMFGARLLDYHNETIAKTIVDYALKVLDALEITTGASHMELKVTSDGTPCLIEVGARPCGDPITPILDCALGHNHIQQTIDALLHESSFHRYPDVPPTPKLHARQSFLVSHFSGTVVAIPGIKALQRLPSVREIRVFRKPGEQQEVTVDQRTQAGFVQLWHPDPAVIQRDYDMIRKLESTRGAMFTLTKE